MPNRPSWSYSHSQYCILCYNYQQELNHSFKIFCAGFFYMHMTNQQLVDMINLHTNNSLDYSSHCIPLYAHGEITSITCLEPVVNDSCSIHTWVKNPSSNWLTRDYIRTVYEYAFEQCGTIVARVLKNNAQATRSAVSTGFTLCYATDQYACYTFTRAQYMKRFSSLYR